MNLWSDSYGVPQENLASNLVNDIGRQQQCNVLLHKCFVIVGLFREFIGKRPLDFLSAVRSTNEIPISMASLIFFYVTSSVRIDSLPGQRSPSIDWRPLLNRINNVT